MIPDLENQKWWGFLDKPMQELVVESVVLLGREEVRREQMADYSFVVFPIAKAYEGFLKKMLFRSGLISEFQLKGRHFRIGRSLNPDLPNRFRDEDWLWDDMDRFFKKVGDEDLARRVWEAWSRGRNKLFHYFADHEDFISLPEARERVELFVEVMGRVIEAQSNNQ